MHAEVDALKHDLRDHDDREHVQQSLIARLRRDVELRDADLAALRERLEAAEHELGDLRAIRDALTPPDLPQRPGLELAAAFLPASAEQVSGDFYLVAAGPQDSTVLVVGDVVGHGLQAARRAAFVRTTCAATAPFSDDPCRLLSWANTALIERAGMTDEFVTAACVTHLPGERLLRGRTPAIRRRCGWMTAVSSSRPGSGRRSACAWTRAAVRARDGCRRVRESAALHRWADRGAA